MSDTLSQEWKVITTLEKKGEARIQRLPGPSLPQHSSVSAQNNRSLEYHSTSSESETDSELETESETEPDQYSDIDRELSIQADSVSIEPRVVMQYHQLTCHRTDGQRFYKHNGVDVPNEPKQEEQDGVTINGRTIVYKKVEYDSDKEFQWRRKLAGMLVEALDRDNPVHKGRAYVIKNFPQDYVLWQQLTFEQESSTPVTKSKTGKKPHANREDAYLFGHPLGRSKKYRSPIEFFPHFLWLMTDLEGDHQNCSCKFCCPDQTEDGETKAGVDDETDRIQGKGKEAATMKPISIASTPKDISSKSGSDTTTTLLATTHRPSQTMVATKPSLEQEFDLRSNRPYMYRPGELVWWDKDKRWGLGVICKRQCYKGVAEYLIQPLSNPLQHGTQQIRLESKIRPYLAWSCPSPTFTKIQHLTFDQVQWDAVLRGDYREPGKNGDPEVDGSILAAWMIDRSYSLFDKVDFRPLVAGETHYNGMFLGGEKVWVGDPVRVQSELGSNDHVAEDVLVIDQLIEKVNDSISLMIFVGNVYRLITKPSSYNNRLDWPMEESLPARMIADLRFRNEVTDKAGVREIYEWKLLGKSVNRSLDDVRGRWYEFNPLVATLRGEDIVAREIHAGRISNMAMNPRMSNVNGHAIKKRNRAAAMGASVPDGVIISKGLDGPIEDMTFPSAHSSGISAVQQPQMMDVNNYIDLDADQETWDQSGAQ